MGLHAAATGQLVVEAREGEAKGVQGELLWMENRIERKLIGGMGTEQAGAQSWSAEEVERRRV